MVEHLKFYLEWTIFKILKILPNNKSDQNSCNHDLSNQYQNRSTGSGSTFLLVSSLKPMTLMISTPISLQLQWGSLRLYTGVQFSCTLGEHDFVIEVGYSPLVPCFFHFFSLYYFLLLMNYFVTDKKNYSCMQVTNSAHFNFFILTLQRR